MRGYDADKLAAGDHAEWTRLVSELAAELLPRARRVVRRSHDAEDVVQSVLCALWLGRVRLGGVRNARLYLLACLLNRARSEAGRRTRFHARPISLPPGTADALAARHGEPPSRRMELEELAALIEEAAGGLRADQREVYRALRNDPDRSGREIARQSGRSHRTVQAVLRRMRRCLDGRA